MLAEPTPAGMCCWSLIGAFAHMAMEAAEPLRAQGFGVTVVDPRWVRPVPVEFVAMAREYGSW